MITGSIKADIDRIWDSFWSGGIANPLQVIEQLTYLIFIKRLDDQQTSAEARARRLGGAAGGPIPTGHAEYEQLRWGNLKQLHADDAYTAFAEVVFPFIREMGGEGTAYSRHMRGARLEIPTPALLKKVVDLVDKLDLENRDTSGDVYEYMLGKIAAAGTNGQFRTPRHIIELMVHMTAPAITDRIVDPASGTCGFLVGAAEYLQRTSPADVNSAEHREHFKADLFHGFDFDTTMLRIGAMNMMLHGVDIPDVRHRDSLAEALPGTVDDAGSYSLVLANPPFAGSLDYAATAKDLQAVVKTKKTELLFLALFLRLLGPGGRAAVVVPEGVLFGSSKAHKELRKILVEKHRLQAVVKLPSGVFKPYAGVSTAIVFFTKAGTTDDVWFYDVAADGYSLDDKRSQLLPDDKTGVAYTKTTVTEDEPPMTTTSYELVAGLTPEEHAKNNLPDVLARWKSLASGGEKDRARTEQSFLVPKADIAAQGYDLSINRYKEIERVEVEHRAPEVILDELDTLQKEIADGLAELREMLAGEK